MKYVNQPVRKTDAMSLVTGKPVYTDDQFKMVKMIHLKL